MKDWLSSLPADKPLAVLTASSVNALSFARSLGRRGVPVLLLDSDSHVAVHSRYARTMKLPHCRENPGAWVEALQEVSALLREPAVLIPTADRHAALVAEKQALLEPRFRLLILPADLAAKCVSKRFQVEHARRLGVPVPNSWFPESRESLVQTGAQARFPCILKPDFSQSGSSALSGAKLIVAETPKELLAAYESLSLDSIPCIVQEIIPGPDTDLVSYLGFWNGEGEEVAFITKRKLRQFPSLYGNGSIQRTENLPEVAAMSRRLLRMLDYRGFAGVEFKVDRRDGSLRFIEINPRSSAMNELAIAAGVDFPWIAYRSMAGMEMEGEPPAFRAGVTCVNEEWDVQAFFERYRRGEMTFSEWQRSLRGAHPIIAAWDDPKPIIAGLFRGARRLLLPGRRS
jgi:predicted ATP-grasp superfamily ATP-dependent carboligase